MKEHRKLILLLIGVCTIQIVFGLVTYVIFQNWEKSGAFGDTFGAMNSLFSSLAFGALVYTIILQSRELKLQREELILNREQLSESARSQKDQAKYMLLAARISAAVSTQEIYANHYLNSKQFPGQEGFNLAQMRLHLKQMMTKTDSLVSKANEHIDE